MFKKFVFTMLLPIFLLANCSSKKADTNDSDTSVQNQNLNNADNSKNLYASLFKVNFEESPEANHYKMFLAWPTELGAISVHYEQEKLVSSDVKATVGNSLMVEVLGGSPIEIKFKSLTNGQEAVLNVVPPTDWIISQKILLSQNTYQNYGRIYFYPGASIVTNGFDLSLEAKKIIVVSDSVDRKANSLSAKNETAYQIITTETIAAHKVKNIKEYNGSNIVIQSLQAIGIMKVGLFGINGEAGLNGASISPTPTYPDPSLNGANGKDAVVGYVQSFKTCISPPTNGRDGQRGVAGRDGEAGKAGGNTGTFAMIVADSSQFQLVIQQKPGVGGKGGAGAPGGPGGFGGQRGAQDSNQMCDGANDGKPGPRGPRGRDGKDGAIGSIGVVEVSSIKNKTINVIK